MKLEEEEAYMLRMWGVVFLLLIWLLVVVAAVVVVLLARVLRERVLLLVGVSRSRYLIETSDSVREEESTEAEEAFRWLER